MDELRRSSEAAARRVLETLGAEGATAWDLKMRLKLSHTRLHLALGMLLERGAIRLDEERLTFRVRRAANRPAAPNTPAARRGDNVLSKAPRHGGPPDSTPQPSGAAN